MAPRYRVIESTLISSSTLLCDRLLFATDYQVYYSLCMALTSFAGARRESRSRRSTHLQGNYVEHSRWNATTSQLGHFPGRMRHAREWQVNGFEKKISCLNIKHLPLTNILISRTTYPHYNVIFIHCYAKLQYIQILLSHIWIKYE